MNDKISSLLERLLQFKRLGAPHSIGIFSGMAASSWKRLAPGITHDLGDGIQISTLSGGIWIICCSGGLEQQQAVEKLCRENSIGEHIVVGV